MDALKAPLARAILSMRPKEVLARQSSGSSRLAKRSTSAAAGANPVAGRAGAADHLAAGDHSAARRPARRGRQCRRLPHAGPRPRSCDYALARPSRSCRSSPSMAGPRPRHAGGGRDWRRSRHYARRRPAAARDVVRATLPVFSGERPRPPRAVPLMAPADADRRGGIRLSERNRARRPLRRSHGLLQCSCEFSGDDGDCGHHAKPIYVSTFTGRPPTSHRESAKRSTCSSPHTAPRVPRDVDLGYRRKPAPTASPLSQSPSATRARHAGS